MLISTSIYLGGWKRVNSLKPIFFSSWSQTLHFHVPDVFLLRLLQKLTGKPTSLQRNQRSRVETQAGSEGSGLRRCGFCSPPSVQYSVRSHPSAFAQSGTLLRLHAQHGGWKTELKHRFTIKSGNWGGGSYSLKNEAMQLKLLQV